MSDNNIVIWGAGRIGRGFIADLFDAAGYHITLVDQSPELIAELRAAGRYTVVCAEGRDQRHDRIIRGFTALSTAQADEITAAVAAADLVAVAVFPQHFPVVAQQIIPGLQRRWAESPGSTLDLIICTNLTHAAAQFRAVFTAALPDELRADAAARVGVVDSLVIRTVVEPPAEERQREPLLVWTNGYAELPVDRHAFRGTPPAIPGIRLVDDMAAEEARKLYTYNMCHAVLAYLGARRGHVLSVACLADPVVRADAEGALDEISRALQAEYGFTADEMARWVATVLRQTDNPTLGDRVARQAADPRRKLRRTDRLVGPALLARKHGIAPAHLARAIAAALLYQRCCRPRRGLRPGARGRGGNRKRHRGVVRASARRRGPGGVDPHRLSRSFSVLILCSAEAARPPGMSQRPRSICGFRMRSLRRLVAELAGLQGEGGMVGRVRLDLARAVA